jgi:RND family efflux transporter MFP subunit
MSVEKPRLSDLRIDEQARTTGASRAIVPVVLVVVLAAVGAALWVWMNRPKPAEVKVATVQETGGTTFAGPSAVLNATGYVTARRRATVSSKITGKVTEVHVEEGMAVKQGQVLARLDDTVSRRYLELSQAELAAARRNAAETEVRLREAGLTLARTRALVKDGITGQAELDKAEAEVDALKARLEVTRQQVNVSEAQVALRRTEIDDMVIRAPFSGIAVTKDAQPGEMISPVSAGGGFTRTGICTIVDMASLEIEVDVNESFINRVTPGQKVEATLDAYPDWRIPAHVIITVPTADRQKATVLVRIGFEGLDPRILPDMGVKVAFMGADQPPAVASSTPSYAVPSGAVRKDGAQDVVFVIKDQAVERRAVKVGKTRGDAIEILSGLAPSERVVVEGPPDLADGRLVTIR